MAYPKPSRISWPANPAEQQITSYQVFVDGVQVGTVPGTATSYDYSFPEPGTKVASVKAVNAEGVSPPTSSNSLTGAQLPTGPAIVHFDFV